MATTTKKSTNKGRPAGLFTWIAIGLVIVVVGVLVIIKVSTGSSSSGTGGFTLVDSTTNSQLTTVPTSVFDTVGVTSSALTVSPPQVLAGQPPYTTTVGGKSLPTVLYVGAEYCPFCAAQRWATIIALSRFGTWSNLGATESSTLSGEVYPGTPTFTFVKAHYSSPYIAFQGVEEFTNQYDSAKGFYTSLTAPTKLQNAEFTKYDTPKYIKGMTSSQSGSIPFISFDNKFVTSGASFSPSILQSMTRSQIAAGLSDPTSPVTQAIIASANYQTATICSIINNAAPVCTDKGVAAAKKAMGLK